MQTCHANSSWQQHNVLTDLVEPQRIVKWKGQTKQIPSVAGSTQARIRRTGHTEGREGRSFEVLGQNPSVRNHQCHCLELRQNLAYSTDCSLGCHLMEYVELVHFYSTKKDESLLLNLKLEHRHHCCHSEVIFVTIFRPEARIFNIKTFL